MDLLVWCKRSMQPVVNGLGINKLVSPVYQRLIRWRYRGNQLAIARQNDRTWKLHPEVALRGEFQEFETIAWLREVVRLGDCVIDVGANVGQMTLEAAVLTGPTGKIVAIEPAPGNFKMLALHVDGNGFSKRVEMIQAACGAEHQGMVELNVFGHSSDAVGSGHNIVKNGEQEKGTLKVKVPLTSLDHLCREKNLVPNVIKIDVEGAEVEVIRGALSTLRNYQPEVQIGFHPFAFADPVAATQELVKAFQSCGYATPETNEQGQYELAEYRMRPLKSRG